MWSEIFSIGSVTVHGYGLMIAIGVLVAIIVAVKRAQNRDMDPNHIYNITIWLVVIGFVGAKLLYLIVEFEAFLADPLMVLSGNGFVVYGGIIAGALAFIVYCRAKKISIGRYLDIVVPSVALAQAFGRIGCFLARCCYGKPADAFYGVIFPDTAIAPADIPLIPTQLISSAGNFLIAALLMLYARKQRVHGKVAALYLVLYSGGRFLVEFLRADHRGEVFGVVSTSQFISIFAMIAGILLFAFLRKRQDALPETGDMAKEADVDEAAKDDEPDVSQDVDTDTDEPAEKED